MIDSPAGYSPMSFAYASETYTHFIQQLLLKWFDLPGTLPAAEAEAVRHDLERAIQFVLVDLESSLPELYDHLVSDLRQLANVLAELVGDVEVAEVPTDPAVLNLTLPNDASRAS